MAEQQAAERTGVIRSSGGTTEYGNPDRIPTLVVDGERYRLVPFAPKGVTEEPGTVRAHNAHIGIEIPERYKTGLLDGERVAWRLDGYTWEQRGKYMIRTEQRGEGAVAVYVKGPANEGRSIDRAGDTHARRALNVSGGAVSSGVEIADAGATWIAQRIYITRNPEGQA